MGHPLRHLQPLVISCVEQPRIRKKHLCPHHNRRDLLLIGGLLKLPAFDEFREGTEEETEPINVQHKQDAEVA